MLNVTGDYQDCSDGGSQCLEFFGFDAADEELTYHNAMKECLAHGSRGGSLFGGWKTT